MTPSERERLFARTRGQVARAQVGLMSGTRDELAALLKETQAAIAQIIASQPSAYQQWSLPQLRNQVGQALREFADQGGAEISSAAGRAWQLGEDMIDEPLDAAYPAARVASALPAIDTVQLTAMRAFMVDRIRDVGAEAANSITAELGLVVIGARSQSEAIGTVTQILGESSRARATTIVRTELGRAFSQATQLRMAEASRLVPGLKKQWRRSGKVHPRLHHDLADGQVRNVDEPFVLKPLGRAPVELMFPRDPQAPASETINCGCMAIPIIDSWKDQNILAHPGRTPGSPLLEDDGDTLADVLARQQSRVPA